LHQLATVMRQFVLNLYDLAGKNSSLRLVYQGLEDHATVVSNL
jgi:hypothetical protein